MIRCLNSILYTLYYHFKPSMDVANHKPMFLKINISNETTNGNKNTVIKNMQLRSLISFPARLQRVTREREMSHFSDFFFQIHFSVIFHFIYFFVNNNFSDLLNKVEIKPARLISRDNEEYHILMICCFFFFKFILFC